MVKHDMISNLLQFSAMVKKNKEYTKNDFIIQGRDIWRDLLTGFSYPLFYFTFY